MRRWLFAALALVAGLAVAAPIIYNTVYHGSAAARSGQTDPQMLQPMQADQLTQQNILTLSDWVAGLAAGNVGPAGPIISVTSNGAKCDGVTDDTIAIQNSLNLVSASGQLVTIPPASCKVTSTLTLQTPYTTLMGAGKASKLVWGGGASPMLVVTSGVSTRQEHSVISGLTLDGNSAATPVLWLKHGTSNHVETRLDNLRILSAATSGYGLQIGEGGQTDHSQVSEVSVNRTYVSSHNQVFLKGRFTNVIRFSDSEFVGDGSGSGIRVEGVGPFGFVNCTAGSNLYDFYVNDDNADMGTGSYLDLYDWYSESSPQFLEQYGAGQIPFTLNIANSAIVGLNNSDGGMRIITPSFVTLTGVTLGSALDPGIVFRPDSGVGRLVQIGSSAGHNDFSFLSLGPGPGGGSVTHHVIGSYGLSSAESWIGMAAGEQAMRHGLVLNEVDGGLSEIIDYLAVDGGVDLGTVNRSARLIGGIQNGTTYASHMNLQLTNDSTPGSYINSWDCLGNSTGACVFYGGIKTNGGNNVVFPDVTSCSMGGISNCTATVVSGTRCFCQATSGTSVARSCSVSGTTATCQADSNNAATWNFFLF